MHRRVRIDMDRRVEVIREARVRRVHHAAAGQVADGRVLGERRLARAGGREGGLQTIEGDAPAVRTEAEGGDDRGGKLLRQLRGLGALVAIASLLAKSAFS